MSAKNGKPCVKCGANDWYADGNCRPCKLERGKKWQAANKGNCRERQMRWVKSNQGNHDKKWESSRRWHKNNPDRCAAHRHKRRAREHGGGGSFTSLEWNQLCKQYDNRCLKCGRDDVKLTADHVIPVSSGGTSDISNIQPLCKSCNSSKGATFKDYRNKPIPERWYTIPMFD